MSLISCKKCALRGATVIAFDKRGCMGEDHRFMWTGTVENFRDGEAVIRLHKKFDDHRDSRDAHIGTTSIPVEHQGLQKISKRLFFFYE